MQSFQTAVSVIVVGLGSKCILHIAAIYQTKMGDPPSHPSHPAPLGSERAVVVPERLRKWWVHGAKRLVFISRALFRRRVTLSAGQAQGQPGCTRPRSSTQSTPPTTQTTITIATSTSSIHHHDTLATASTAESNRSHIPIELNFRPLPRALKMALDSFFHNKIESMKLEIIQGQAVLRRLEAQRNDYNSRGRLLSSKSLAKC